MKRKKILVGVAIGAALTAVALQGCDTSVFEAEALYGPPPEEKLAAQPAEERSVREMLHTPVIGENLLADSIEVSDTVSFPEER